MIYYIYHSSFAVELEKYILIFDFYKFPKNKKETENFFFNNFVKRNDKKIFIFSTHSHADHFNKEILSWLELNENIKYILSDDIKIYKHKNIYFTHEGDKFEIDGLKICTFGSTDLGSSFYINADNKNIFHSGDLHFWHWEDDTAQEEKEMKAAYLKQIYEIQKLDNIDIAFVPVDPRLGINTFEGVEIFNEILKPKVIIPMHFSDDYSVMKNLKEKVSGTEVILIEDTMSVLVE